MELEAYLERLLAGDSDACVAAGLAMARDLDGLHRLYVELIEPSQRRVGQLWEAGELTVAGEHLATAINSFVASTCYAPLARATSGGPRALVVCTPEELHDLGPRMFADLLECDGWDVDFYGTSLPTRDLIGAIEQRQPRFVGLSTALVLHLGTVKRAIDDIRGALGEQAPTIVVGGAAYRGNDQLWRQVGADMGLGDASTAVAALSSLK